MSVRRHSNGGTVVVTLGDGDTMISLARPEHVDAYSSIVLYNGPARTQQHDERYDFRGDEIVLEFTHITGVLSLCGAMLDMLSTWPMDADLQAKYRAEAAAIVALIKRYREEERQQNGGEEQ